MELDIPINTIIKGDCIEILKTISTESIDLIFADPPYNMQTDGELLRTDGSVFSGVNDNWDKFDSLQSYDSFCEQWLSECRRILKPNGAIWVIGSFQNIYRLGNIMQNLGFWIMNDVIWSKPNAVPNFLGTRFQNSHETLIWCAKSKKSRCTFNYKTMKQLNGGKQMKSVWDIGICIGNERLKDESGKKIHSTQKPERLLYNIIISSTKTNDIVLDPFFGTGTTGAVAKLTGRRFIGIEREEYYIKHAQLRINSIIPILTEETSGELEIKPPKVSMKDLIAKGYLQVEQLLYNKAQTISVEVKENGYVQHENDINSIHKISAKLLNRSNHNGWDYFWCYRNGEFVSLDSLRYLVKEEDEL